jgi:hypothetical protein
MTDITYNAAVSLYLADCDKHKHLARSTLRVYKITLLDFARSDPSLNGGMILLRDIPGTSGSGTWTAGSACPTRGGRDPQQAERVHQVDL